MRCALVLLLACGGQSTPVVEVAQPLPTPTVVASASAKPVELEPARDDLRDLRGPPRAPRLVAKEAELLEKLFAAMATSSPDRPMVLHRLGDAYAELRKHGEAGASAKAIARYERLLNEHTAYAKIDVVRYYLGLEHEQAGHFTEARRSYYELIKNSPDSPFVPWAYYAFGEMFLEEGKTDPSKLALAQQAYMETTKASSEAAVANAARCRLARIFDAQGEARRAADMRQRAHDCGAL